MLALRLFAKAGQGINKAGRKLSNKTQSNKNLPTNVTFEALLSSSNNAIAMTEDDKFIIVEQLITAVRDYHVSKGSALVLAPSAIHVNLRTKTVTINPASGKTFLAQLATGTTWLGNTYNSSNNLTSTQYNLLQLRVLISALFEINPWSIKSNLAMNAIINESTPIQNHVREIVTYLQNEIANNNPGSLDTILAYAKNPNNKHFLNRGVQFKLVDGEEKAYLPAHRPGQLVMNPTHGENKEHTTEDIIQLLRDKLPLMHMHSFKRKNMPTSVKAMHTMALKSGDAEAVRQEITQQAIICDNHSKLTALFHGRRKVTSALYSLLADWERCNAEAIYQQLTAFFDTHCSVAAKLQYFKAAPQTAVKPEENIPRVGSTCPITI